jgi:hypothetical protein
MYLGYHYRAEVWQKHDEEHERPISPVIHITRYAAIRRVAGSSPDEVIGFLQFTKFFQPHYGPGVDSAS